LSQPGLLQFFPLYKAGIERAPFYLALQAAGVCHEVFPFELARSHKTRFDLIFRIWPLMIWAAILCGMKALKTKSNVTGTVWMIADTHLQASIFCLLRKLTRSSERKIILFGFIFNTQSERRGNFLKVAYVRWLFRQVEFVVCHSRFECGEYEQFFKIAAEKFRYVPWASGVPFARFAHATEPIPEPYAVAAGRSWRDYETLISAASNLPIKFKIICDSYDTLPNKLYPPNIEVLRTCFGEAYHETIQKSQFVVIPLSADRLSAGQMVLVQAFYFGKPLVISDTPTVRDYVKHEDSGLLVPINDQVALHNAMARLMENGALYEKLSKSALREFDEKYSDLARIKQLLELTKT
jgi:glycosyltransferase involved in cell wall biosynthesis